MDDLPGGSDTPIPMPSVLTCRSGASHGRTTRRRRVVTTHCVDRYWERAASGFTRFADALAHLQLVVARAGVLTQAPAWLGGLDADALVALGPDVVLVIQRSGP